jgi:hypothetical protein
MMEKTGGRGSEVTGQRGARLGRCSFSQKYPIIGDIQCLGELAGAFLPDGAFAVLHFTDVVLRDAGVGTHIMGV